MPRCHISLGGNLGPVADSFATALDRLRNTAGCAVASVSRLHETTPIGEQAGVCFLNAVAELETVLEPLALLDLMQSIEIELGRTRTVHWGPRTIDLDLLYYGSSIIELPRLTVPHPAAWYRRFVLDPLAEIAPELMHPVKQATIESLRERLLVRPLPVALTGGNAAQKLELGSALDSRFAEVRYFDWDLSPAGSIDPALLFWLGASPGVPASAEGSFDSLPRVPRIDASAVAESPVDFVCHVVQSALG